MLSAAIIRGNSGAHGTCRRLCLKSLYISSQTNECMNILAKRGQGHCLTIHQCPIKFVSFKLSDLFNDEVSLILNFVLR